MVRRKEGLVYVSEKRGLYVCHVVVEKTRTISPANSNSSSIGLPLEGVGLVVVSDAGV